MEIVTSNFVFDDGFTLSGGIETIGNAFVVCPDHDAEAPLHAQVQFVAHGRVLSLAVERSLDGFLDGSFRSESQLAIALYLLSVSQGKTNGGWSHQQLVV